jgi:hypothetical protein
MGIFWPFFVLRLVVVRWLGAFGTGSISLDLLFLAGRTKLCYCFLRNLLWISELPEQEVCLDLSDFIVTVWRHVLWLSMNLYIFGWFPMLLIAIRTIVLNKKIDLLLRNELERPNKTQNLSDQFFGTENEHAKCPNTVQTEKVQAWHRKRANPLGACVPVGLR